MQLSIIGDFVKECLVKNHTAVYVRSLCCVRKGQCTHSTLNLPRILALLFMALLGFDPRGYFPTDQRKWVSPVSNFA